MALLHTAHMPSCCRASHKLPWFCPCFHAPHAGIGYHLCLQFKARGATVYGTVRKPSSAKGLEAAGIHVLTVDVTDHGSIQSGVDAVIKKEGRIDILVNNAGISECREQRHTNSNSTAHVSTHWSVCYTAFCIQLGTGVCAPEPGLLYTFVEHVSCHHDAWQRYEDRAMRQHGHDHTHVSHVHAPARSLCVPGLAAPTAEVDMATAKAVFGIHRPRTMNGWHSCLNITQAGSSMRARTCQWS